MKIRKPQFKVTYNGKNITEDISRDLISVTYTDRVQGASDEIDIKIQDAEGKWINSWYPTKGDKLKMSFGYDGNLVDAGGFEIDEIEISGAPDTTSIKALAAGVKSSSRSETSTAFENQTLRQIAQTIASRNGLTVTGTVPSIQFERVTQNQETDLGFLKRLSYEYGCLFSIRDNQLVFTSIYNIEKGSAVVSIDRTELKSYSFRDKTTQTYKSVQVSYHNPKNKEVVNFEKDQGASSDGIDYDDITTDDVLRIRTRAESEQQAEAIGKAALHRVNSKQLEGDITVEGNPLLVAGNNVEITGLGVLSGKFHIEESRHTIDRSGGYSTNISIKRVGKVVSPAKKKPAVPRPIPKPRQTTTEIPPPVPPFSSEIAGL